VAGKKRVVQKSVRLKQEVLDDLEALADRVGIASSTLAGLAIGEYVAKAKASFVGIENIHRVMAEELAKQISAPMVSILEDKTPEELNEMFKDD